VWRASLKYDAELVSRIYRLLSDDEQVRADRFFFEEHRRQFIAARGLLRMILAGYLGSAPPEIRFGYTRHGKPVLSDSSPEGIQLRFNLAHSHGLALFSFTRMGEIGVDLERIRHDFSGDDIARRYFSPAEVANLNSLSPALRRDAFFSCWTRKEAFVKAKGAGLSLSLDQFDVTLSPEAPAALVRTRWDEAEVSRWSLNSIAAGAGYVGALAVEARDWRLSCWQVGEEIWNRHISENE
jgi:4'-phosphopantetheinyl transferase